MADFFLLFFTILLFKCNLFIFRIVDSDESGTETENKAVPGKPPRTVASQELI